MYVCPNAVRAKTISLLLCRALMTQGVNYKEKKNALQAVCAFQRYCPLTKRAENLDNARGCFEKKAVHPIEQGKKPDRA